MAKSNQKACPQVCEDKRSKKQRSPRVIKTAVLCLVIGVLASAIAGLSVALYYSTASVRTHESYQRQMDAVYFRAYYDLIDGANDLGISLKKLGASSSPSMQQSLLYDVWGASELAGASLGVFDGESEGLGKAQKFVNQLGDYSHTLALRVSNGQPLTTEERAKLVKLGEVARTYLAALERLKADVDGGKLFVGDGGALESIDEAFSQFTDPSFEYPEMIYDGPFSDALEGRAPVGLEGDEMTREDGGEMIVAYFDGANDIEFAGEGRGDIPTLNYAFKLRGGNAFAQVSKVGGKLIAFNLMNDNDENSGLTDENITVKREIGDNGDKNNNDDEVETTYRVEAGETCQRVALDFANKLGYDDMQVVWSSSAGGECVVNLAPVQDGAILYPDLVKVKVDENKHMATGFDATHYALNHKTRELPSPVISEADAAARLSLPAISEGRLALIPLRGTREVLTYEYECESDGTYFVYIDAVTGDEANILFVIDDEEQGQRTA